MLYKKNKRLYSQNLREDLYLIEVIKNNIINSSENKNFLALKRHLYTMRFYGLYKNLQPNFPKKNMMLSFQMMDNHFILLERLILLLPFNLRRISVIKNHFSTFLQTHISSSLHSAFVSIETKWQYYSYILESQIPSCLHPELFIRMISTRMLDMAYIDLLRRNLHNSFLNIINPSNSIKNQFSKSITTILWNLWILEFENFLQKEFCIVLHKFGKPYDKRLSFLKKLHLFNLYVMNTNIEIKKNVHKKCQYVMHIEKKIYINNHYYLRYANNCIIGVDTNLSMIETLKYRSIRFWKYRIGILMKSSELNIINLYQNSFCFLGTISKIECNELKIEIMTSNGLLFPITYLTRKSLLIILPLFALIKVLSKYGFCKSNGYPISKSSWSTWPDSKIIERFSQIFCSIKCHYSGCINRNKMSHIQYILCYSCAKTLACKHKTNLRSIWYNYANEFTRNYLGLKKNNTSNLRLVNLVEKMMMRQQSIAIWNLDNINQNNIVLYFVESN
jgi:hypothetical protein